MPPMAAAVGSADDVEENVAQYVLSLSGSPHDYCGRQHWARRSLAYAPPATALTAKVCRRLASANLTDNIWLHGFGEKAIVDMDQWQTEHHAATGSTADQGPVARARFLYLGLVQRVVFRLLTNLPTVWSMMFKKLPLGDLRVTQYYLDFGIFSVNALF